MPTPHALVRSRPDPAGRTLNLNVGAFCGTGEVVAHVKNDGEVLAGATGRLTIAGNYTQSLEGTLVVELGGTAAGVNHSLLVISNRAEWNGRLLVRRVNEFVPSALDSFSVIKFGSSGGDFVCRDGFFVLGHGRRLQTQFEPTGLTLPVVVAPDPEGPSLSINDISGRPVLCWPSEFSATVIQTTDNLSAPKWVTLGTDSFLVLSREQLSPERYYRLFSSRF